MPLARFAGQQDQGMSPNAFQDSDPSEIEAAQVLQILFARLDDAEVRCDAFVVCAGSELDALWGGPCGETPAR